MKETRVEEINKAFNALVFQLRAVCGGESIPPLSTRNVQNKTFLAKTVVLSPGAEVKDETIREVIARWCQDNEFGQEGIEKGEIRLAEEGYLVLTNCSSPIVPGSRLEIFLTITWEFSPVMAAA